MYRPRVDLYTALAKCGIDLQQNGLAVLDFLVHFTRKRLLPSVDNFVGWNGVEKEFSLIGELGWNEHEQCWLIRVPSDATHRLRNIMHNQTCTLSDIYLHSDTCHVGWRPWLLEDERGAGIDSIVLRRLSLSGDGLVGGCVSNIEREVKCFNPVGVPVVGKELRDWVQEGSLVLVSVHLHVHSVDNAPSYDVEVISLQILDHSERIPFGSYRYPFYGW